mmetsp:Transcript_24257/g.69958  ORF Transcript_24257/g.69958 Transcript_24257/m.69958 type:complete len:262 (-) Transcript_24257:52-837(-)
MSRMWSHQEIDVLAGDGQWPTGAPLVWCLAVSSGHFASLWIGHKDFVLQEDNHVLPNLQEGAIEDDRPPLLVHTHNPRLVDDVLEDGGVVEGILQSAPRRGEVGAVLLGDAEVVDIRRLVIQAVLLVGELPSRHAGGEQSHLALEQLSAIEWVEQREVEPQVFALAASFLEQCTFEDEAKQPPIDVLGRLVQDRIKNPSPVRAQQRLFLDAPLGEDFVQLLNGQLLEVRHLEHRQVVSVEAPAADMGDRGEGQQKQRPEGE